MKKLIALLIACLSGTMLLANHWTPESAAYSDNMPLYGVVQINGVEQYSDQLEVGVFCGDECRGSAVAGEFFLTNRYLVILTIYGNNGDQLTFKLYDHCLGEELDLASPSSITFNEDGFGNPVEPYILSFTGQMPTAFHFAVEGNWSEASNWCGNALPGAEDEVLIDVPCQLDMDATVASLTISEGQTLTVQSGRTLTVTGTLTNTAVSGLVIEDGAQLYAVSEGVQATVKKTVTPYTPGQKDGWHLIAHPMVNEVYVYDVENLSNNEYDLYYYDEPTVYWINQEDTENNFTAMEASKGYLYGNNQNVTLGFSGYLQDGFATVNVPLSYTTDHALQGFNLVGNPFAHNVTSYASENVADGCYVMNEAKDDLIVSEISEENPLRPAEGFFVKATADGASITFNPGRGSTATQSGSIRVEVESEGKLIDRLIVKDAEGLPLEKLSLNEHRTKLFAQGEHQELAIVPCEGNEQAVSFKAAKNGQYTVTVDAAGMDFIYLHLIDNLTGADVDLLSEPSYTFEAMTSDYASRFKLVFLTSEVTDSDNDNFAFFSNGCYIIGNDGEATLQIIDLNGRILSSETIIGSCSKHISAASGLYLLRLINGDNVKVQKVIVQ